MGLSDSENRNISLSFALISHVVAPKKIFLLEVKMLGPIVFAPRDDTSKKALHEKRSFPLRIFLVNVIKSAVSWKNP